MGIIATKIFQLFFCLLLVSSPCLALEPEQEIEIYQKISSLTSELASNPDQYKIHLELASLYTELGNPAQPAFHLTQALALNPADSKTRIVLARLYLSQGEYSKALQEYQTLLTANPNSEEALLGIAKTYAERKKYKEAKGFYAQALSQNPASPEALLGMGLAQFNTGQYELSVASCKAALELKASPLAWNCLGNAQLRLEAKSEAKKAYRQAYMADPNFSEALFNLAAIEVLEGNLAEAERHRKLLKTQNPHQAYKLAQMIQKAKSTPNEAPK